MDVYSVITLDDGKKWELLDKVNYNNLNYFLACMDKEYKVFKEIKEQEEFYVEEEKNEKTLLEVLKLMSQNFGDLLKQMKVEELED